MTDNADDIPQPMHTTAHDPRILEELHIVVCVEASLDVGSCEIDAPERVDDG